MKTRVLLTMVLLAIIIVSCIPSLYPLYREKDLIFDARLVGQFDIDGDLWEFEKLDWTKANDFNTEKYRSGKTYRLLAWENEEKAEFVVHLIKLEKNYYLDFFPVKYVIEHESLDCALVPAHVFSKVEFVENNLVLNWFDGEFLNNMIDSNKVKISHMMLERGILLTANTEELQKFVRKFGDYPEAYVSPEDPDTLNRLSGMNIQQN